MRKCWTHNSRVDQAVVPVGGDDTTSSQISHVI